MTLVSLYTTRRVPPLPRSSQKMDQPPHCLREVRFMARTAPCSWKSLVWIHTHIFIIKRSSPKHMGLRDTFYTFSYTRSQSPRLAIKFHFKFLLLLYLKRFFPHIFSSSGSFKVACAKTYQGPWTYFNNLWVWGQLVSYDQKRRAL